jgi:Sel1 repeat
MFPKTLAIGALLLLSVSAGTARADANDDYNRCADLQDQTASVACIEKLAQSGNAIAQLALGGLYAGGAGMPQDPQQAVYWYEKSAEQGNAAAMSKLGDAYLTGTGVTEDDAKAAAWFGRAASAGDPWSLTKLGSLYEAGQGVAQDDVAAYQWFDIAAAKGDAHAAELRDALAQKMTAAQIAAAKQRSSEWLAQSATQATVERRTAFSKTVSDCAEAVRGTQPANVYMNFDASYDPAKGKVEINSVGGDAAVAIFDKCMAAKGYSAAITVR